MKSIAGLFVLLCVVVDDYSVSSATTFRVSVRWAKNRNEQSLLSDFRIYWRLIEFPLHVVRDVRFSMTKHLH